VPSEKPKAQHYVHRAYLAGFQDPQFEKRGEPALWVYVPEKKPFRQRPERVARRNYYYCFDREEKKQFIAEYGLQKLEDLALPILRQLSDRKFSLSAEDRLTFAGYVAMAHTRVPTFERFLDFTAKLIAAKKLELLAQHKQALESVVAEMSARTGESIDPEDFRKKLTGGSAELHQANRGWTVQEMFENLMMLQQVIFEMKWGFLLAAPDDDGFLTSDNPVSLFDPLGGPMGGIGFKSSPAAHFTFPISRNVCLLAQHLPGPEARELNPSSIRTVNKGTITRADSQLYAPFASNGVQEILNHVVKRKGGPKKVLFSKGLTVVKEDSRK
jgi:uncharacterized protein DUF4238